MKGVRLLDQGRQARVAKKLSLEEIRAILESGIFDGLIGAVEDERIECKAAPYQLQHAHQKQELAKDVSAFANAEGGMILIGVRTERDPTHFGDEIREISCISQDLVNPQQYQDVLGTWIYPPIQQVDIRWFPSADNQETGILAILIPPQASARRPFLVTRIIDDRGKQAEVVFGYVERRRAAADPTSVQELHTLLRDGLRYDVLNEQYERIEEGLGQLIAERTREARLSARPDLAEMLAGRVEQALTESGLHEGPAFILVAVPGQQVEIPPLFERRDAEVVRLLESPPELRHAGFDLTTGAPARMVGGQLRRAVVPEWKVLELWRDGTLIFAAAGDDDFLSRARRSIGGGPLRINQLVLIEATYLFVELSRRVYEHCEPRPTEIEYRLELRSMTVAGGPCALIPGPVGTFAWKYGTDIRRAPAAGVSFTIRWRQPDIHPGDVAYLLVREVYGWFGIEYDQIPYTAQINGRTVISPEEIRRAGRQQ